VDSIEKKELDRYSTDMSQPLIGLTTTFTPRRSHPPIYGINRPYATAIQHTGGLPVLIPNNLGDDDLDQLLSRLDGVLFTGGYDIDPACYGLPGHPLSERIDHDRDRLEIHLVKSMAQSGQPFFGICRGLQIINVALGGSLYEHLPDQLPNNVHAENHDKPRNYLAHSVSVVPGSQLSHILGKYEAHVNSLHHQGVRQVAPSLIVSATAPDGLVEGCELPGLPFALAVQWHPEELQEDKSMSYLFAAFIQACQANMRTLQE
jgi:putative glutamine amidotransferase